MLSLYVNTLHESDKIPHKSQKQRYVITLATLKDINYPTNKQDVFSRFIYQKQSYEKISRH